LKVIDYFESPVPIFILQHSSLNFSAWASVSTPVSGGSRCFGGGRGRPW
jgi:hypothetical protein